MVAKYVVIYRSAVESILSYAKALHPREGVLLLRGRADMDRIVIEEVVVPPLAAHGRGFSNFPLHMLPNDFSIMGTAHSHPSGLLRPSIEDLNHFYGRLMIIAAHPYESERQISVLDKDGNAVRYEIVSLEDGRKNEAFR